MKTLETLYSEVMANDELKKGFTEAAKDEKALAEWLKKNGTDASVADLRKFLSEKLEGEMADEDTAAVAGGKASTNTIIASVASLGIACGIEALISEVNEDDAKACLQ